MKVGRLDIREFLGKPNNRRVVIGVIAASLIVHILGGLGAAAWIVARFFAPPDPTFEAPPMVVIPPQIVDPEILVEEFQASASRPALDERIMSLSPLELSLPDIPKVESPAEVDPNLLPNPNAVSSTGFGSALGSGTGTSGFSFFGIRGQGTSVLFVIDISGSMVIPPRSRKTWERLEEELRKSLSGLSSETRFNIVVFSARATTFRTTMQRITPSVIDEAVRWVSARGPVRRLPSGKDSVPDGSFFLNTPNAGTQADVAFERAFRMNPDVIIFLSDGAPTFGSESRLRLEGGGRVDSDKKLLEWIRQEQAGRPSPIPIHAVGYMPDSGEAFMRSLAEQNGGRFELIRN